MTSFEQAVNGKPADAPPAIVRTALPNRLTAHPANPPSGTAMQPDAEDALMAAIAAGDQAAFDAVVRSHLDAIHGYLYRLTGSRADAEDLAQETFLRLWRKAGTYQPGRVKVSTWLHTIAHRLGIDSFRRNSRSPLQESNSELMTAELPDQLADPARQASAREVQSLLETAITALPEGQRAAILLCQVQGFSNAQAAEILAVNTRALESLLARARRALRKSLAAYGALETEQWD